jgi:uncharacterized protein
VSPLRAESITITGSAGGLQAVVEEPGGHTQPAAYMVVCHPHPLHGGTMDNKVATTLARCAHELGAASVRFNFRGVGASEGSFDDGRGELDDALKCVAYGRQRWPDADLWLAGFSFGGYIALRASTTRGVGQVNRLVTVAPAMARHFGSAREIDAPGCPWQIIQGDADEVIDANVVIDWAERIEPPPTLAVFPGVGHFFHGQLLALRDAVVPFLVSP